MIHKLLHGCHNLINPVNQCDSDAEIPDGDIWFDCLEPDIIGDDADAEVLVGLQVQPDLTLLQYYKLLHCTELFGYIL